MAKLKVHIKINLGIPLILVMVFIGLKLCGFIHCGWLVVAIIPFAWIVTIPFAWIFGKLVAALFIYITENLDQKYGQKKDD